MKKEGGEKKRGRKRDSEGVRDRKRERRDERVEREFSLRS